MLEISLSKEKKMIPYVKGDIFQSPAQGIVNTGGVMEKGLALEFRKRYPDRYLAYRENCRKKKLKIGTLMLPYEPNHWILLFPTKEDQREPSHIEYIKEGGEKFVKTFEKKGITSIAFPRLGCGNGGLDRSCYGRVS